MPSSQPPYLATCIGKGCEGKERTAQTEIQRGGRGARVARGARSEHADRSDRDDCGAHGARGALPCLHDEFLDALVLCFREHKMQTMQLLGRIKHESDHLCARVGGAPTGMRTREQRRLNGVNRILGPDLHLCYLLDIESRWT